MLHRNSSFAADEGGDRVDFIILSLDRAEDTLNAIESALEQEKVDSRVFVVDQGSKPMTKAALKARFGDNEQVHLEFLDVNLGVAGGRNYATRLGSAPYVIALDNDAIFETRLMAATAVADMKAEPELAVLAFRVKNYFNDEDDWSSWCYPASLKPMSDRQFDATQFCGCAHAIRRQAFENVGAYDDALFFCGEEKDVAYRLINAGWRLKYSAQLVVRHKVHPEARVHWSAGRYYYAVRNSLYSSYKFGTPLSKLTASGAAWLIKGFFNKLYASSLRGVGDAIVMCLKFRRSAPGNSIYRLSNSAREYIAQAEARTPESLVRKVRKQFVRLRTQ